MTLRLLVLVGPTACGKTRMAVTAARRLGTEIVSADSRQVYRGLDIGSGKDVEEYARGGPPLICHLIDVADPRSIYTVYQYQRDCYRLFEAAARANPWRDGTPLVLAGGSGLYVEAVLRGYRIANVPEDVALRETLMGRGRAGLVDELRSLDPELAQRTDLSSRKRIVRAIEVARYGRERALHRSPPSPVALEHAVFCVDAPRDWLERRIDERLEARLAEGLVAEVEALLRDGVPPARMDRLGLEYREVTAFLTGAKSEARMVEDLRRGIRRLAKRQRTWFRGLPRRGIPVTWIAPGEIEPLLRPRWRSAPVPRR